MIGYCYQCCECFFFYGLKKNAVCPICKSKIIKAITKVKDIKRIEKR